MNDVIECLSCGYEEVQTNAICRACGEPLPTDDSFMKMIEEWFEDYTEEE